MATYLYSFRTDMLRMVTWCGGIKGGKAKSPFKDERPGGIYIAMILSAGYGSISKQRVAHKTDYDLSLPLSLSNGAQSFSGGYHRYLITLSWAKHAWVNSE